MKRYTTLFLPLFLLFLIAGEATGQNARQMTRKGNKLYEEKKYTEAEVQYMKSLDNDKDLFESKFNLADAMIRQKKYDQAIEQLQILAGSTEDKEKLAKIYHNMGNALLQKKELEKSVDAYKNSLRNDPGDDETRYNLAYAQSQLNQQQQQQKNQDQNKDQKDKDKQKQDQDKKNQDQQDQQKQDEQDKKEQEDQQKQQQQNQDQQQQKQDEQEQQPNPNEISKQHAEQILQSLMQDEQEVKEKVDEQKKVKARSKRVDKEW